MSQPCPTASELEPHGSQPPGPSGGLTPPPGTPTLPVSCLPDISLAGPPLVRNPFSDFLAIPSQRKQGHSLSSSLSHHYTKKPHVCATEVVVGVEPSPTWGNQDTPKLTLVTGPRPSSEQGEGTFQSLWPFQGHYGFGRWNHGRKSKEYYGSGFV